ncbi:hypothetical protein CFE53_05840 [Methanofervidicoccus sp. A16]|uniref:hypothetical protein n=1 Tax=Methanofervidicoccus sp. A16 TaxID=2607662 RepID=UPI00118CD759|nr:hypothetical protein [Methanofervidicoccus sp. A16]AXI25671.1 hypothetical protein CFE53_05840 [Methanofervidicoccus sp. A16]
MGVRQKHFYLNSNILERTLRKDIKKIEERDNIKRSSRRWKKKGRMRWRHYKKRLRRRKRERRNK